MAYNLKDIAALRALDAAATQGPCTSAGGNVRSQIEQTIVQQLEERVVIYGDGWIVEMTL